MTVEKLILFDIDGTLIRTKGAGRVATQRAMLELYGTAGRIDLHHFGGKTDWLTLVELLTEHGYDHDRIGETMPEFEKVMAKHLEQAIKEAELRVLPGAMELVQGLLDDPRVLMGIVTGNTRLGASVKLRAGGFDPVWFKTGAYGSESVDRNHLSALALSRACALIERDIAPERVFVVGDTVMDIACARAIGAVAVAVKTGFEDHGVLADARPDFLLEDLTTFLDVLAL